VWNLVQIGVGACVDGPWSARGFLRDLAFGTSAVMCPAYDAVPV
jgi:hypothetical protein